MFEIEEIPSGWDGARRGEAGISCVCVWDSSTERFHVYSAKPFDEANEMGIWDQGDLDDCLAHLNSADLLVGFNSIDFDTPALQSVSGCDILPEQYDILREVWRALGKRQKGFRLNDLCKRHGIGEKTETGESAPKLYKSGRHGRLIDYCINDVHLTLKLARLIEQQGYVETPEGEQLLVRRPDVRI